MLKAKAELKAQITSLLERAKAADQAEKNEPDLDVPAEIARRQDRLQAIEQARARLEKRQREAELQRGRDPDDPPRGGRWTRPFGVPEDKAQENFTDPDSRIMKRAGGGFDASYNAQTAVDEAAHIVVAAELTNIGSDAAELPKMLASIKSNLGQAPRQALADAGYRSEAVFEQLADGETVCRATQASRPIANANGSPNRPTGGSRMCWDSGSSVCEVCTGCKPNGSLSAWP